MTRVWSESIQLLRFYSEIIIIIIFFGDDDDDAEDDKYTLSQVLNTTTTTSLSHKHSCTSNLDNPKVT